MTYELEMIANHLQNAHAYPRLLPHLAAKASSRTPGLHPRLVFTHPMLVLVRRIHLLVSPTPRSSPSHTSLHFLLALSSL